MPPKKRVQAKVAPKGKSKARGGCVTEQPVDDASSDDDVASLQTIPDHNDAEAEEGAEEGIEADKAKELKLTSKYIF